MSTQDGIAKQQDQARKNGELSGASAGFKEKDSAPRSNQSKPAKAEEKAVKK